ncbi:MAG: NADH-quinone oxidoreductase subunit N [Phycisphaerales bacterium]|nr:NADH-quinone oxidoreductase subunit N [Phycisphaerales bacterium]
MIEAMSPRLILLVPEMILFAGAVLVAVLGLSRNHAIRSSLPFVTCAVLIASIAAVGATWSAENAQAAQLLLPMVGRFVKPLLAGIGVWLVLLSVGAVDRRLEESVARGRMAFDPQRVVQGEYYAFFLLSLMGAMLLCNANDLIWLFLAIELVSLPTYIMVAVGGTGARNHEAGVKYFFLGAMSTAVFLYGFALIYGSTGSLEFAAIRDALAVQSAGSGIDTLATIGLVLSILGLCFKITAVPMHFYAPDVYEGAPTHVTAFLSFVPKVAGFTALILILTCVGWSGHSLIAADGVRVTYQGLPTSIAAILWMIAILTMTLGNIGALLQTSIKRMLAYSSIAHSGYLILGLIAGAQGGIEALYFYLVAYGVMTTAAFAALCALERKGEELNSFDDLTGLRVRHPVMAWMLALSAASLVGMPPFIGFFGKIYLFIAAFEADQFGLVLAAVLNSAVSALYYLRLALVPLVSPPAARSEEVTATPSRWPQVTAVVLGVGTIVISAGAGILVEAARCAIQRTPVVTTSAQSESTPVDPAAP